MPGKAVGKPRGWALALVSLPLLIGVLGFLALFLGLLAASGHWVFFWVLAAVEGYMLLATVVAYRSGVEKRRREA